MARRRFRPWEIAEATLAQAQPLNADDPRVAVFCPICRTRILEFEGCQLDHDIPLGLGGADESSNLRWTHRDCHKRKTHGEDMPRMRKADRQAGKTGQHARRKRRSGSQIKSGPMPGTKASKWRKSMRGTAERRT